MQFGFLPFRSKYWCTIRSTKGGGGGGCKDGGGGGGGGAGIAQWLERRTRD